MNLISNIKKPITFTILALAVMISSVALPSGSSAHSVVSYPLLKAKQKHSKAEVRKGYGMPSFDEMREVLHSDSVKAGDYWRGEEGERICVKYTDRPDGNLAG